MASTGLCIITPIKKWESGAFRSTTGRFARALVAAAVLLGGQVGRSDLISSASRPDSTLVAFRNVTVLPMDSERVLAHQTVVVRGDRIVAVGDVAETPVPSGATVVDGTGKYLIPGIADMHVHFPGDTSAIATENALTLFVAGGVTTIRALGAVHRHLAVRDSIAKGKLLGPAVYVAGSGIGALPGNTADLRRVLTPSEIARFVAEMKRAGYDFIQVGGSTLRGEYEELANAARKAGIPLTGAVPVDAGLARVLHARQASIENLDGYLESLERDNSPIRYADPVTRARRLQDYYDETKIGKVAASVRNAGIANTPTLFINYVNFTPQPAESLANWPEMRYVAPRQLEGWKRQKHRAEDSQTDPDEGARTLAFRNKLTKGLHDAGALILVGSDAPNAFLVPGFSTLYEIHSLTVAASPVTKPCERPPGAPPSSSTPSGSSARSPPGCARTWCSSTPIP